MHLYHNVGIAFIKCSIVGLRPTIALYTAARLLNVLNKQAEGCARLWWWPCSLGVTCFILSPA